VTVLAIRRAIPRPARARRVSPGLVLAWAVLALVAAAVAVPGLLAHASPDAISPLTALAGPGAPHHLLGTDQLGRDTLSRIIYGARPAVGMGVGATAMAVAAGSALGLAAALGGPAADTLIMRVTDVLLAFPGLLLALLVVAVLGPGTLNATLAIGCSMAPGFARLARGQALVAAQAGYVRAAQVLGTRRTVSYLRHVLPNALPPLLVLALASVGAAIIAGSSLSFLGLGPQAPVPEWGAMLSGGIDYMSVDGWLALFPGLAITATVLAINVTGRSLQRRFEGGDAGAAG
jgi:peptide/nickel transport system permease protein